MLLRVLRVCAYPAVPLLNVEQTHDFRALSSVCTLQLLDSVLSVVSCQLPRLVESPVLDGALPSAVWCPMAELDRNPLVFCVLANACFELEAHQVSKIVKKQATLFPLRGKGSEGGVDKEQTAAVISNLKYEAHSTPPAPLVPEE